MLRVRAPRVAALAVGAACCGGRGLPAPVRKRSWRPTPRLSAAARSRGDRDLLRLPIVAIQGLAFVGGLAAVGLVLGIGTWVRGHDRVLTLVLTGVVVGSLFGAGISFAKYVADPYHQLPAITFWLLGSFSGVLPRDLAVALPLIAIGFLPLALLRWRINVLSLPDDEARALGVDVLRLRIGVIAAATLVTSAGVAIAGIIGWVGLVIPHAARLLVGAEFARVLPISRFFSAPRSCSRSIRFAAPSRAPSCRRACSPRGRHARFHLAACRFLSQTRMSLAAAASISATRARGRRGLDLALAPERCFASSGPTARANPPSPDVARAAPAPRGRVSAGGRDLASLARAEIAAKSHTCHRPRRAISISASRKWVEMGRTAHLGAVRAAGTARPADRARMRSSAWGSAPVRAPGERCERRRTPARPHRPRARHRSARTGHGRAHRQPDFGNQSRVLVEIGRLRDAGVGILLCSHDPIKPSRWPTGCSGSSAGNTWRRATPRPS